MMENYLVRVTITHSSCTCLYTSLLVLYLFYTNNIYKIGKLYDSCIMLLLPIIFGEMLKISANYIFNDIFKECELVKLKKNYINFKLKEIVKMCTTFCCATVVYYVFAVLFGASLWTSCEETFILSLLVALLSIFSAVINIGADNTISLLNGVKPYDDVFVEMFARNIHFTLLGTWLGATVIPLDWERPWQEWPISCCIGALFGYIASSSLTLFNLFAKIHKVFSKRRGRPMQKYVT